MNTEMSERAQSALLAGKATDPAVTPWLQQEGYVGPNGGLTAKGQIERMKIMRRREDEAFG